MLTLRLLLMVLMPYRMTASFERIISEQRDHELIVFDLPKVPSENYTVTFKLRKNEFKERRE